MKIEINQTTLIDQVEDSLLTYFKKNDLRCGDSIPNENNLAAELGQMKSAHAVNENLNVSSLARAVNFYVDFIRGYDDKQRLGCIG